MEPKAWNWKLILSFTNLVGCAGAVFCGLFGYVSPSNDMSAKLILINFYLIVFALAVILAELRLQPFLKKFRFLGTYSGRVLTLLFIASLLFIFINVQNVIFGIFLVLDVCIQLWVLCIVQPDVIKEEKARAKADMKSMGVSAKETVASGVRQGAKEAVVESAQEGMPSWASGVQQPQEAPTPGAGAGGQGSGFASDTPAWARGIEGSDAPAPGASPFVGQQDAEADPHNNPFTSP